MPISFESLLNQNVCKCEISFNLLTGPACSHCPPIFEFSHYFDLNVAIVVLPKVLWQKWRIFRTNLYYLKPVIWVYASYCYSHVRKLQTYDGRRITTSQISCVSIHKLGNGSRWALVCLSLVIVSKLSCLCAFDMLGCSFFTVVLKNKPNFTACVSSERHRFLFS